MAPDAAHTAGRISGAPDLAGELESALARFRREPSPRAHEQPPQHRYGPELSPEEALARFDSRQTAYARSIEHGLYRLKTLANDDRAGGLSTGLELWPDLSERLAQYSFPRRKRTLDLLLSVAMLVILTPLMVIFAALIRLDSPGPVLFRTSRLGQNGRRIRLLKFRTMVVDAEARNLYVHANAHEGLFKIMSDPRVTRIGRLLRRTSLDELPIIFNVLVGDLSFVGPQALREEDYLQLGEQARIRLRLRPGVTGLSQVASSSSSTTHDMLRLDYLYAARWTLRLDLKILLKTVSLIWRRRRY